MTCFINTESVEQCVINIAVTLHCSASHSIVILALFIVCINILKWLSFLYLIFIFSLFIYCIAISCQGNISYIHLFVCFYFKFSIQLFILFQLFK